MSATPKKLTHFSAKINELVTIHPVDLQPWLQLMINVYPAKPVAHTSREAANHDCVVMDAGLGTIN